MAAFYATFSKKVAKKYTISSFRKKAKALLILFFLQRKEPKENRRCANRSLLPA